MKAKRVEDRERSKVMQDGMGEERGDEGTFFTMNKGERHGSGNSNAVCEGFEVTGERR
jgi:hypothetical protein